MLCRALYNYRLHQKQESKPVKELSATTNINYGSRLHLVDKPQDIPARWVGTPIEDLIAAHNFGKEIASTGDPRLLLVSCIEYRFRPEVPHSFAYVSRSAGGRLIGGEFAVSYILAKGVRHIALIGHNDCGMTKVDALKNQLIDALVGQDWEQSSAKQYVEENAARFKMDDEIDALYQEFTRLTEMFPKIEIAPLFVSIASTRLHIPKWYMTFFQEPSPAT
jgi:carbonic anhydrase